MMKEKVEKILKLWNIESEARQIYETAWAIGDQYVLKTGDDIGGLERNITIMKLLGECGVPVAHPVPTVDERDYIVEKERYYLVMNKLSGSHLEDIYELDYSPIAYETGKIMAKLHKAFLICEKEIACWDNSLLDEMNGWICKSLKENNFKYISESDFEKDLEELKNCYSELPKQLIHRDMHYGNILFNEDKFSGYIDFDLSQKNIRLFDLCYFLIGLVREHEKNKEDREVWLHIVTKFIQGYENTIPLTVVEKESICCVMKSIELLFLAYFLNEKNEVLAEGSASLYYFVKENEKEIHSAICNSMVN